ncbi:MAG: type I DNA topoisomerase [Firmicutes bacterium]|nr:type I DNA topoisomerase [Bacillota bacterium]
MSKIDLIIVESPAKARTIKKYLGSNFNVASSMGHIRDLPKKHLGVDVNNGFEPTYSILKNKKNLVKELKHKASNAKRIFLATDPDREGEAIAWHLSHILGLNFSENNRIAFNEITKFGINEGINSPRKINMWLVNSQQARRILDRLVGYKLSPFLCQKIQKGLSAGRVQSVTLRIIMDRESEIKNFKPEEYWSITANLKHNSSNRTFKANFWGNQDGEIKLKSEEQTLEILKQLKGAKYIVLEVKKGKRNKNPAPPFITASLQQESARKLGFTSKKTMKIAQELYEGVDVDEHGTTGLITYMRTDSVKISEDAAKEIEKFIVNKWGKKYLPNSRRNFKNKPNAQEAHEAIRPTIPSLEAEKIKNNLTSDQFKIYKLIWDRFAASQMSSCVQNTVQVKIKANEMIFKASGSNVEFDGFTVVYTESKDEKENPEKMLPDLEVGMECTLKKLEHLQHFTEPPSRFNEASLIKTLEENGVGRPSTYSNIISTITNREYAIKENKNFVPTELGTIVNDLMKKYFSSIVNIKFTAEMEAQLDKIEKGNIQWKGILNEFYDNFENTLKSAKEKTKDLKIRLKENETDIICEKCQMPMVIKRSRFGKFIACSGYPDCKNIKKFLQTINVKCYKCNHDIVKKSSKKGKTFYGCSNYPNCDFVSWDIPTSELCPHCKEPIFQKGNKKFCLNCKK